MNDSNLAFAPFDHSEPPMDGTYWALTQCPNTHHAGYQVRKLLISLSAQNGVIEVESLAHPAVSDDTMLLANETITHVAKADAEND